MGIMICSLLWVMQDLYHQPYDSGSPRTHARRSRPSGRGCRASGLRNEDFEQGLGFRV